MSTMDQTESSDSAPLFSTHQTQVWSNPYQTQTTGDTILGSEAVPVEPAAPSKSWNERGGEINHDHYAKWHSAHAPNSKHVSDTTTADASLERKRKRARECKADSRARLRTEADIRNGYTLPEVERNQKRQAREKRAKAARDDEHSHLVLPVSAGPCGNSIGSSQPQVDVVSSFPHPAELFDTVSSRDDTNPGTESISEEQCLLHHEAQGACDMNTKRGTSEEYRERRREQIRNAMRRYRNKIRAEAATFVATQSLAPGSQLTLPGNQQAVYALGASWPSKTAEPAIDDGIGRQNEFAYDATSLASVEYQGDTSFTSQEWEMSGMGIPFDQDVPVSTYFGQSGCSLDFATHQQDIPGDTFPQQANVVWPPPTASETPWWMIDPTFIGDSRPYTNVGSLAAETPRLIEALTADEKTVQEDPEEYPNLFKVPDQLTPFSAADIPGPDSIPYGFLSQECVPTD